MDSRSAGDCQTCEPTRNQFCAADAPVGDSCRSDTCPRLNRQDKSIAKCGRNRSPRLQKRFQVCLRRLLESQNSFTSVASMRMTTGQQFRLRDPHPAFIAAQLNLRSGNNHGRNTISEPFRTINVTAGRENSASVAARCIEKSTKMNLAKVLAKTIGQS